MQLGTGEWWIDELVTAGAVARAGTQSAFYRNVKAGRFHLLTRGVYVPDHVWRKLDRDERFRARIQAASLVAPPGAVFSHLSAAAMWRLPMVGAWPEKPELFRAPAPGGRSGAAFTAHVGGIPPSSAVIDRIRVTDLPRTIVDVARTALLGTAVAMADAALAAAHLATTPIGGVRVTAADLLTQLESTSSRAGHARCRRVLELADGASGSPGESVSRVGMYLQGLPPPILQHEFRDRRGRIGFVDFWWPEFGLIGEFDGLGKYTREEMLAGKSPADAVIAEKRREDRLRALGPRMVRWGWETAISPPRLAETLRRAGLR